ncbi:MAG: glucosaminidase domain-containing protein [Bacteroidota bacterium]
MGKAKHDIPMFVIDKRTNQEIIIEPEKETKGELTIQDPIAPAVEELLQQLLFQVYRQVVQFYTQTVDLFNYYLGSRKIPWLKIAIIALAAFVLLKKDMQFNLAFKAPMPIFNGDEQDHESGLAQTMSMSGGDRANNPYAPASPAMLKDERTMNYVKKHADAAIKQMHEFGIPASIKMAQALVESRAGTSMLAKKNNNHFGIKCFSRKCKKGHCTNAYDDHHKDFFRKFDSTTDSWQAHSRLISQGRYAHLKKLGKLDYKGWAHGLKKAGYATDKRYAEKLINTIEKYQLYELDKR